jgi:regulator of nucleoside diphosphate kinase
MSHHVLTNALPRIIVGEAEEVRLTALATTKDLIGREESVAQVLLAEVDRAYVVRDSDVPPNVVRMYSLVEFETDGRERRRVELVYPGEADINQGRISILTPIGAALIGLSCGQAMTVQGPDGATHKLRVVSVAPPRETPLAERSEASGQEVVSERGDPVTVK